MLLYQMEGEVVGQAVRDVGAVGWRHNDVAYGVAVFEKFPFAPPEVCRTGVRHSLTYSTD
jgi:hypothetical protein